MSKNQSDIPFTELVERASQLARIANVNERSRVRGAVNDEYVYDLPTKEDWSFFKASSSLTCTPSYNTGTVSVNTQSTTVTFSSDVTLDSTFTGRQIKFTNNDNVYLLTFQNTTGATITPPLSGDQNITSGPYTIFSAIYSLASDFDRFIKNGGLQKWQGGRPDPVPMAPSQKQWYETYTPSPGLPAMTQLVIFGTSGVPSIELTPPPVKAYVFPYDYIHKVSPMSETTAGYITINAGSTVVTGSGTLFTQAQTGWYLRIDAFGVGADSEWYRIGSITHDSSLTLSTAFGVSGASTALYTLCPAPAVPTQLQTNILYGATMRLLSDQGDPLYLQLGSMKAASLIEARKLFKSRVYPTEIRLEAEEYHFRR